MSLALNAWWSGKDSGVMRLEGLTGSIGLVEACPEQLIPSRLAKFSDKGLSEEFEKWHGLECVECGSCSFACPAKRQLAQSIKTMKKQVLAAKRKK